MNMLNMLDILTPETTPAHRTQSIGFNDLHAHLYDSRCVD